MNPQSGERPIVVRGSLTMFGIIIGGTTIQRWMQQGEVPPGQTPPSIWFHVIPLVLASSMVLQFFAKKRNSPLLMVSLILVIVSLLMLWALTQGWL